MSTPLSARPLQRRPKPPRAFCVRLSQAIPSESRCFKHLVEKWSGRRRRDQLVYVRWETLGDKISLLGTRPINERLLEGLLSKLIGTQETESRNTTERDPLTGAPVTSPDELRHKIRTQIMGVSVTRSGSGGEGASSCRLAIEKLACRLVYPSCHFRLEDAGALVRPPCREDCLALRDAICPNLNWPLFNQLLRSAFNQTLKSTINALDLLVDGDELAATAPPITSGHSRISSLSEHKIRASGDLNESLHYYWPHEHSIEQCDQLPPLRPALAHRFETNRLPNSPPSGFHARQHKHHRRLSCSNAHLTEIVDASRRDQSENSKNSKECLGDPNGASYLGTRNVTRSGWSCQDWIKQTPHKHQTSELLFDNMREARNFCRNPGGLELLPWCYTTNPGVRWDFCNIEQCNH